MHKTLPQINAYQIPLCFHCDQPVNLAALRDAYRQVLSRYPLLTSRLHEEQGVVSLTPQPVTVFDVQLEQVAGLPQNQVLQRLRDASKVPLPLDGPTLIDARIYQDGEHQWWALLRVHHIVFDGTSALLFLNHLLDAYQSLIRQTPARLDEPQAHFAEFILWQDQLLKGERAVQLQHYWAQVLQDAPLPLELPSHAPRDGRGFEGGSLRQPLPQALLQRVDGFCASHGLTRAVLFLGVFNGLLSRYSQQQDIVVGMPTLGRPQERFAQTIGYFMNMVPIRSQDIEQACALDYFKQLQETVVDALDHSDYPFPTLIKTLKVPRNEHQRPLFNIAFAHQNFASSHRLQRIEQDYLAPLGITMVEQLRQEGEYELELEIIEGADEVAVNFKYATALFERSRIERLMAHYLRLLDGVLQAPQRSLADHEIIGDDEQALLQRSNATDQPAPAVANLLQWLYEQVARDPGRIAYQHLEQSLSYGQVLERVQALGNYLRSRGIGPGAKVAICVERSLHLPVAALGVLHSGAAYVPLDPAYPAERQRYMLEDSGACLLLTQATISRDWSVPCDILCLDQEHESIAAYARTPVPELAASSAADLAYLIYTSGSTGKPKGVMVAHSSLNNFLFSMAEQLQVKAQDRLLAVTTFSFDIAGLELFLGLVRGAQCILCEAAVASDAERLKRLVEQCDPTLMQATPTTWQLLFQVGWQPAAHLQVLCGGEAMPAALLERFRAAGVTTWNLYGPTETTIWSSAKRIEQAGPVTIGAPIANTRLHILNQYQRLQPLGVAGELAIAGAGLALGYHRLAELTAQKFVDDPFHPGQRMFMTGDNVTRLEDGDIRCLGRRDLQIKLRGHRIDVEEIETCIVKHCPVQSAVVVLHPGAHILVAYLQSEPTVQTAALIATVKAQLGQHLPPYMLPQRFICQGQLPMTANGKVDRKALMQQPLPTATTAQPQGGSQVGPVALVRDVWQQVLGYAVEDDDAGFFDVGGDSVSAVQVAQQLSEQLHCKVAVTLMFEHPTINRLAGALQTLRPGTTAPVVLAPHAQPREPLPTAPKSALDGAAAVIGMSCQFAESADLEAFWDNLCQGRACVTRWSEEQLIELKVPEAIRRNPQFVPVKAVLEDKHAFDASFFGLSPRDASFMSPAFKHLLMHAWRAFEDAGYLPEQTARTAVYISAAQSLHVTSDEPRPAYLIEDADEYVRWLMGQGGSIPTMISYKLGLTGPSVFMQTNCSSSLVALQAGLESIRSGAADYALVGAATVFPVSMAGYLHQPGLNFSSTGQCRAFDAQADGMVGGEGVAMLLLKRASLALADADPVYAMLNEVQTNNDGALKAGFFAPSVTGQAAVIAQVLSKAGVAPQAVGYIETHGTGTSLGDPVEFSALSQAYGGTGQALQFCGLGSVKSNIGHTDTAAGLAGSIKAILSLAHQQIPPTLHLGAANPQLDLANSPFFLVDRLRPWPAQPGQTRYAAVSSFGVGGTNAHALFSRLEPALLSVEPASTGPYLVVVSAKTDDKRRVAIEQLLAFVRSPRQPLDLADLAYTLQVGRKAWPQRLALVAQDHAHLCRLLESSLSDQDTAGLYQGQASRQASDEPVITASAGDLHLLAQSWVRGARIEWAAQHGTRASRRLHLPTYPFITERERNSMSSITEQRVEQGFPAATASSEVPPSQILNGVMCWVREEAPQGGVSTSGPLLVIAREAELPAGLNPSLHIDPDRYADEAALVALLRQHMDLAQVLWLVPDDTQGTLAGMLAEQRHGVIWGAAFLRALAQAGYHERALQLTVVTRRSVAILDQDPVVPTHSGVHGLVGTVIKEHAHWQARLLDLDDVRYVSAAFASGLGFERSGRLWARRSGDWFRPALHPLEDTLLATPTPAPAYRQGGVYVIVGGAGAIGQDLSAYLIEQYQAQVVWIGRQALDATLQATLERLGKHGPTPLYLRADATDLEQVRQAIDQVRQRFAVIHGVVHSAMARENQALHRQPVDDFQRNLHTKVAIALNLAQVFKGQPLDFLLFFSSINGFYLASNSAAYAAGGSFISSLADHLNQRGDVCAKVVYWGHWQTAALRDDIHGVREHLARSGFGVVKPEEGMSLLETFLGQPLKHLASFRLAHSGAMEGLHLSGLGLHAKQHASVPGFVSPLPAELQQAQKLINLTYGRLTQISSLLRALLWRQIETFLGEAGLAVNRRGRYSLGALAGLLGEGHYLLRWLQASLRILEAHEEVTVNGDVLVVSSALEERVNTCWERWQAVKEDLDRDPFLSSISRFIDVAIQAIPDVLGGRKKATDVFFSNSSMALVESIYKENPVVHYYGTVVGGQVTAQIKTILAARPDAQIRLLEVGAGTGSCTEHVLAALKPFAANIAEYCFTDLSQLFLQRAERRYRAEHPYLKTRIFNVEKDPLAQGFSGETFDVVIAANVIHATQDIRTSVRHIQSLMQANGNFLLLELTENSLFSHLTFGQLEGWWRFSDPELRMPFGPALAAPAWRSVLLDQGFASVTFPCQTLTGSDLQVVVAGCSGFTFGPPSPRRVELPAKPSTPAQPVVSSPVAASAPAPAAHAAPAASRPMPAASAQVSTLKAVRSTLAQIFADNLGVAPSEIDGDESLGDYGLDSIIGVKLVQQINARMAVNLVAGALYEFNTLNRLAAHIVGLEGVVVATVTAQEVPVIPALAAPEPVAAEPAGPVQAQAMPVPVRQGDIAIVGISAQFPGANSLAEFWANIEAGVDCVREVPPERWDWQQFHGKSDGVQARTESRWGGFIDNIYHFDPLFFELSPYEAALMDPQQRLLLKHSWLAIEDAGVALKQFAQKNTGVFMAVGASEYAFTVQLPVGNPLVASSISSAMVANRISHLLNLRGPSEHYDTGCSSSLVALHRALQSMASGECEQALVGGVQLILSPLGAINLGAVGFLSSDGKSRSFQSAADGFVRSEGVGVLVLKRLEQAIADQDDIYAVLKGSGVAHGGKGVSLTAPNALGMKEAINQALTRAGVEPSSLSYVETHGIASAIGDSIEVQALNSALAGSREGSDCALSSLKPVIGHAEIASGMGAVIKTALALRHRQRPGVPGYVSASEHLSLDRGRLSITEHCRDWPAPAAGHPRRAGVNSFGFGGVNGFAVLEEYVAPEAALPAASGEPQLLLLSARQASGLRLNASRLLEHLQGNADINLAQLAAALWRKTAMPVRLALVASDLAQAISRLQAFIASEAGQVSHGGDYYLGDEAQHSTAITELLDSSAGQVLVQSLREQRDYPRLAGLWASGLNLEIDPQLGGLPRMRLPAYGFDERICKLPAHTEGLRVPSLLPQAAVAQVETTTLADGDDAQAQLRLVLAELLQLAPDELDFQRPVSQYGIDSLTAVMLQNRIVADYGVHIGLARLLGCRTFAELSQVLPAQRLPIAEPIVQSPVPQRYRPSIGQQGLWTEHRYSPDQVGYNIPYALRITGQADPERLFEAARQTVRQHPLLGARFELDGEHLWLRNPTDAQPRCRVHGVDSLENVQVQINAAACEPFDLEHDALLRVDLFIQTPDHDSTVLLLTFHHAVFDGSSLPVFLSTFLGFYEQGEQAEPVAPSSHYSAFVEWQTQWLDSPPGLAARAFWENRLAVRGTPVHLHGQQPARQGPSQYGLLKVALPTATLAGLAGLCAKHQVSSYNLMLAAFGLLLRAHGGQSQVRIGTPFFGRPHKRFEDLVGYFVNLLVMPLQVPEPEALAQWLPCLQGELLQALEHGHYPYPRLHQALAQPGEALYDAVFIYQNWVRATQRRLADTGKAWQPLLEIQQRVDFPLAFEVFEGEQGSTLSCHFDQALYPPTLMQRLQDDYLALLARLPALMQAPVLAAHAEQSGLIGEFEQQVARTPGHTALIDGEHVLTYEALNRRANQIARQLAPYASEGAVVGLLLAPGFDFVATALATWKLGMAYLALDAALPASRLEYMVNDSNCQVIITRGVQTAFTVPLLDLDACQASVEAQDVANLAPVAFQALSYVIYTSGSQGTPKGVKGSQQGTLNRLQWGWEQFPYHAGEVCCQKTSLNFVDHVAELFAPLLRGVPTVIVADHWIREHGAGGLAQALSQHRITRMVVIPSLLRELLHQPEADQIMAGLRYCLSSGESLSVDLAQAFYRACPDGQLINIYGSSEMSADATFKPVIKGQEAQINIGRALSNVHIVIADEDDRACAVGGSGELLVAGEGLALGYLGQGGAHDQRFVLLDPDGTGVQRYFRSGDLGHWLANGEIVLSGRKDQQVKVNGQRIEPEEIEAALRGHAGVVEALVRQNAGQSGLEAFLQVQGEIDARTLREHLGRTLPLAMLPQRFYRVEQLPRLASGKLDRRGLDAATAQLLPFELHPAQAVAPQAGEREQRLLQVVANIAQKPVSDIGLDQDFFQSGFDSFRFVRLADALSKDFGVKCSPADFYRYGTPRQWLQSLGLPTTSSNEAPSVTGSAFDEPIAVVGMAGVFPGADDLDSFWQHLYEGTDLISETPSARWRWQDYLGQPGGDVLRWGGFINNIDQFSPAFFGLSPLEAEFMDPQHRVFLESAWHALEDAGYAPRSLPERDVGVFVGISSMDYAGKLMLSSEVDPLANFGNGHSMLPNRVSYLLNLTGPSVAIDTACSSSLVAIHEGIKAIRSGDCRWALVGGVNILLEPRITQAMGKARMLSPKGRCQTFGAHADGYVRGEGAGVLVLKTLKQALADNDQIHGVIRASGVNHGGRSSSMTAPNPQAQSELIQQVYQRAGVRAGQVSYIETHGTGTPIGDPIEVNALKEAWQRHGESPEAQAPCALGAVKSNIGHLEAAAGIAGAIKVLLCLKHKTLVKNLHGTPVNSAIDLLNTPFYLPQASAPWEVHAGQSRMAGLSSFGIGGTNAHLIFEEFSKEHADE